MQLANYMRQMGSAARTAAGVMAMSSGATRNAALEAIVEALGRCTPEILAANEGDLEQARAAGLAAPLLERLSLHEKGIKSMCDGLLQVAALPDPVAAIDALRYMPSGIQVGTMRVPLGVVGVIYESRPGVTADAAALCLKAGNAVILRGGSESLASNQQIASCIRAGLSSAGLPEEAVQLVETTDRAAVGALITMPEYVDVIIPRGGAELVQRIDAEARVPVIRHLDGICHVYLDDQAEPGKARAIALNAKTQRYGVCNAMETLLVAAGIAAQVLPQLLADYRAAGVELRACEATRSRFPGEALQPAREEDWRTEYLAPILALKTVAGLEEAIAHINQYGSGHTDAIVTEDYNHAWRFLRAVDSSSVLVNASTRFADGYEYGLGAEIGISTNKLHARGPVGVEGLTTKKFLVLGDGHIRH